MSKKEEDRTTADVVRAHPTAAVVDLSKQFGGLVALPDGSRVEKLPAVVYRRLEEMERLHDEYTKLHAEHLKEKIELERKYRRMYLPIFGKRADIISGRLDPAFKSKRLVKAEKAAELARKGMGPMVGDTLEMPEPVDREEAKAKADEKARRVITGKAMTLVDDTDLNTNFQPRKERDDPRNLTVGVPGFWLQALKNNPELSQLVTARDEDCLSFLLDIEVQEREEHDGFRLLFHFGNNPYFTNTIITKEYTIPNYYEDAEHELAELKSTDINWRKNKNLCSKFIRKKLSHREGGRWVTRQVHVDSFFSFFTGPTLMLAGDDEDEEEVYNQVDADLETALTIKDKIVPDALRWFTGEAAEITEEEGEELDSDDERKEAIAERMARDKDGREAVSPPDSEEEFDIDDPDDGRDYTGNLEIRKALTEAFDRHQKLPAGSKMLARALRFKEEQAEVRAEDEEDRAFEAEDHVVPLTEEAHAEEEEKPDECKQQ